MNPTTAGYRPGEHRFECAGTALPQDAKSAPLDVVAPDAGRYLQVGPEPYFSAACLERERALLWPRTWLCAGLARDVAETGQWIRFDVGCESYLIVRGVDGELRAFHNVCQHRGMPLVAADSGSAPRFVCRFHSWTYDTLGRCTHVMDRPQFQSGALAGSLELPALRCAAWGAFVFVCADPAAPSLEDYLGPVPATLEAYGLERMHVVKDVVVDMECNWKLVVHINQEAYHFHRVHREALPYADDFHQQIDFYPGGHNRFMTATGIPSPRLPATAGVTEEQKFLLREVGIDPADFDGGPGDVRRALQLAKRRPDNVFGLDYSRFSDNQLTDDWSYSIFPNMSLNVHPEGVLFMRYLPHRSDPGRSLFHVMILVPPMRPGARPPGYMGVEDHVDVSGATRPARQRRAMTDAGLGWALDQDCAVLAELQRGVQSRGFRYARLSEQEARIRHFWSEYARYVPFDGPTGVSRRAGA
jgi:phenylpropionate dioxygenase-like ring-hydroxylating dioxygenase large terminal subunit